MKNRLDNLPLFILFIIFSLHSETTVLAQDTACRPPPIFSESINNVGDCMLYLNFDSTYYDPNSPCYHIAIESIANKENCEISFLIESQPESTQNNPPTSSPEAIYISTPTPIVKRVYITPSPTSNPSSSPEVLGESEESTPTPTPKSLFTSLKESRIISTSLYVAGLILAFLGGYFVLKIRSRLRK